MNKVILIVDDGWGIAKPGPGNYITQAKTPNFDDYIRKYPSTVNKASGNDVGLPKGSQGNSEVGHLHMGAGRIVWQLYEKINRAIRNKSFFKNKVLKKAMNNKRIHLIGLCSDEGVHAHTDHLLALLRMARGKEVYIHFFADGRDVPEKSALKYVRIIERKCRKLKTGKIASIIGRYYSMDRDSNWNRTKKAYDLLILGKGFKAKTATEAIKKSYKRGDKTDYYIQPTIIDKKGLVKDGDSVFFFNFRTDRLRQLTKAFKQFLADNRTRQWLVDPLYVMSDREHKKLTSSLGMVLDAYKNVGTRIRDKVLNRKHSPGKNFEYKLAS